MNVNSTRQDPRRRRRPLIAALAALLVALALVGLLSIQVVRSIQASNVSATSTAMVRATSTTAWHMLQTEIAGATQTVISEFPYTAAAPGPGCDHGWAGSFWRADVDGGTLTCFADHSHLVTSKPCGPNCANVGGFNLDLQRFPLPSHYTLSIQVMHLSVGAFFSFRVIGNLGNANSSPVMYTFNLDSRSYTASSCTGRCQSFPHFVGSGRANPAEPHTLAITVQDTVVTFAVDGRTVGSETEQVAPVLRFFDLNLSGAIGANAPLEHADLANFSLR